MKRFPKYLNTKPTFVGLTLLDLVIVSSSMLLMTGVDINPLWQIALSLFPLIVFKWLLKNIDLIGFINSSRNNSLDWTKLNRRER